MTKLEQLHLFLQFYYADWGAAKGEVWESLTNGEFNDETAERLCRKILDDASFSFEDIHLMKIVIG